MVKGTVTYKGKVTFRDENGNEVEKPLIPPSKINDYIFTLFVTVFAIWNVAIPFIDWATRKIAFSELVSNIFAFFVFVVMTFLISVFIYLFGNVVSKGKYFKWFEVIRGIFLLMPTYAAGMKIYEWLMTK